MTIDASDISPSLFNLRECCNEKITLSQAMAANAILGQGYTEPIFHAVGPNSDL